MRRKEPQPEKCGTVYRVVVECEDTWFSIFLKVPAGTTFAEVGEKVAHLPAVTRFVAGRQHTTYYAEI